MTTKEFKELVEVKGLLEVLTEGYLETIEDNKTLTYHTRQAEGHLSEIAWILWEENVEE